MNFSYRAPLVLGELTIALTKLRIVDATLRVEYVAKVDSAEFENLSLIAFQVLADVSTPDGALERIGGWYSREEESILWEGGWSYVLSDRTLPTSVELTLYVDDETLGLGQTSSAIRFLDVPDAL